MIRSMSFVLASVLALTAAWPAGVLANGDLSTASCVIPNQGDTTKTLGPTVAGTVSVVVTEYDGASGILDVTARLQWQGRERVFRKHIVGSGTPKVTIGSEFELACLLFLEDPVTTDTDPAKTLSQVVGVSPTAFKISSRSFTGLNFDLVAGSATTASAISEITIYVRP